MFYVRTSRFEIVRIVGKVVVNIKFILGYADKTKLEYHSRRAEFSVNVVSSKWILWRKKRFSSMKIHWQSAVTLLPETYIYMARHFMIYITQAHRKINVICDIDEATNQCKMSITCHKGSPNVVFSVANCLRVLTSPKRSTSVCMTYSCRPWCFPRRTHLCTTILITEECGFRFAMRILYVHLSIFQLHSRRQVD